MTDTETTTEHSQPIVTNLDLLKLAVDEPGTLSKAYSAFHNYSIGNQMLAMWQCAMLGLPIGPISTAKQWKEKGYDILPEQRGNKIQLCQPFTGFFFKDNPTTGESERHTYVKFWMFPFKWYVVSQTNAPKEAAPMKLPGWDKDLALTNLGITMIPFDMMSGNTLGYSKVDKPEIAINPLSAPEQQAKTLFHELAHNLMHSRMDTLAFHALADRSEKEVQAEGTAFVLGTLLGFSPEIMSDSRGYIQHWIKGGEISEDSATKIFATANQIYKAGQVKEEKPAWKPKPRATRRRK